MLRQLAAILTLPFVMLVLVPAWLASRPGALLPGWGLLFPLNLLPAVAGLALMAGGLSLVVTTVRLFARVGQGTLAPWDPTRRLVVRGVYGYVRNPMISGVVAVILGEALLLGSRPVLVWALIFMAVNLVYLPLIEEPGLRRRFGAEYEEYARNVPRWVPRRKPWYP
jgi:protein-S-isoprenylcysteine O-methyltransferase Ste14